MDGLPLLDQRSQKWRGWVFRIDKLSTTRDCWSINFIFLSFGVRLRTWRIHYELNWVGNGGTLQSHSKTKLIIGTARGITRSL